MEVALAAVATLAPDVGLGTVDLTRSAQDRGAALTGAGAGVGADVDVVAETGLDRSVVGGVTGLVAAGASFFSKLGLMVVSVSVLDLTVVVFFASTAGLDGPSFGFTAGGGELLMLGFFCEAGRFASDFIGMAGTAGKMVRDAVLVCWCFVVCLGTVVGAVAAATGRGATGMADEGVVGCVESASDGAREVADVSASEIVFTVDVWDEASTGIGAGATTGAAVTKIDSRGR